MFPFRPQCIVRGRGLGDEFVHVAVDILQLSVEHSEVLNNGAEVVDSGLE